MTQACDLANGVEIEFSNRGLRLRPYELTTRAERHKFSYARAKISIEAANLIEDYNAYKEPVLVKIGGVTHHRYYVPDDGITFGEQQAWIELIDPLRILEEENIEDSYDSISLQDIVTDIFNERNDPNGLLTGVEVVNSQVAGQYSRTLDGDLRRRGVPGPMAWAWAHLSRLGSIFDSAEIEEGGFFFDDVTLYDALADVEEEYGVISWVDKQGVLCIGLPELRTVNGIAVFGDPDIDTVNISGYNVGTSRNSLVYLQGRSTPFSYLNGNVHPHTKIKDATYFVAEAKIDGEDGNHGSLDEPVRVRNQDEIESVVRRKFVEAYMRHNSGNIEFNGLSSEDQESLAKLDVGDLIGVAPEINHVCGQGIEGGQFIANKVTHNINARVGWQITVSVSRTAPEPEVNSWIYDPATDTAYERLEDLE